MDSDSDYSTDPYDLELFHKLGLQTFVAKPWEKLFVGKVDGETSVAFIWVTCAPSQFWHIEVVDHQNNVIHELKTATGRLRDYWPQAEILMSGVFLINNVPFKQVTCPHRNDTRS